MSVNESQPIGSWFETLLPLAGVLVVVVGFALRLKVTVVVLAAGLVAGAVAGMAPVGTPAEPGILDTLGRAFSNGRLITLFVLALPAIGLSERYGLQEQARRLIASVRVATVGRLQVVYQVFRIAVVGLGIRLGSGHVTFSRPLIVPMALAADGLPSDGTGDAVAADRVKAASGASENYGNFFGQNLFPGAAGVVLVLQTLETSGHPVSPVAVSFYTLPIAAASVVIGAAQYVLLDRWLARRRTYAERGGAR
jgi:uncharacterized membrane protein